MKPSIHPVFHTEAKVVCSCGNTFITGSTKQEIHVEVCYKCHPLYTGEKRYIDTLGQVGKFQKKQETATKLKERVKIKKTKKTEKEERRPKSLKELLMEV